MSRKQTKRANAIDTDFTEVEKLAQKTASDVKKVTATLMLLVPFMHDNILNLKGDLDEEDRKYLRDQIVPLFEPLLKNMAQLQELFDIHDDDSASWKNNLTAYLQKYPNCITEAEKRYPS